MTPRVKAFGVLLLGGVKVFGSAGVCEVTVEFTGSFKVSHMVNGLRPVPIIAPFFVPLIVSFIVPLRHLLCHLLRHQPVVGSSNLEMLGPTEIRLIDNGRRFD